MQSFNVEQRHVLCERLTQIIAAKVVGDGDTVLDLGANVGYHTAFLSQRVGTSGKVHAFEPNPELWSRLIAFPNVRLWPVAVGDEITVERFILPLDFD